MQSFWKTRSIIELKIIPVLYNHIKLYKNLSRIKLLLILQIVPAYVYDESVGSYTRYFIATGKSYGDLLDDLSTRVIADIRSTFLSVERTTKCEERWSSTDGACVVSARRSVALSDVCMLRPRGRGI